MNDPQTMAASLQEHLVICREMLQLVEEESRDLTGSAPQDHSTAFEYFQRRKDLLPRLQKSLDHLKQHRIWWQHLDPGEKLGHPEVESLIQMNQDLIMKAVYLDRENEKARLQQGLFGPRHLPSAEAQKPHFVADMYRRHHSPQT